MPEIAEVARVVHFLRLHLVGKRIKSAQAVDDISVFNKVGTTGDEVAAALTGRKVVSAGSQGKYFWTILDKPPHLVMHLGMTGWMHIKGEKTGYTSYYNKMKPGEADQWPPKYWKFKLETDGDPKVEVAFTDARRFGRVRLVDCPAESIRHVSPLMVNGPDPVVDADVFTEEYLRLKIRSRKVPIKALLLDQTVISGIGNWVGDEVLYQAKLHPEQYCDGFDISQINRLYEAICYVCREAVDKLGDSDQFPEHWLFHYRWGKGAKDAVARLPNGEKLAFLTVGGRTSCYAPNIQKITGRGVPNAKEEPVVLDKAKGKAPAAKEAKQKASTAKEAKATEQPSKKRKQVEVKAELPEQAPKKAKSSTKSTRATAAKPKEPVDAEAGDGNRRRSARLKK